ncbi:MAG: leucine-rich repeat protein [Methanobrevibacter sp.]|nr:leucine-rich repeat protein [Methanobrevibacter sp.]
MPTNQLTQSFAQVQADLNLTENLQAVFSTSKSYEFGDVVIYNNELYKCKEDVSAGSWDSSKWEKIDLQNLVLTGINQDNQRVIIDEGDLFGTSGLTYILAGTPSNPMLTVSRGNSSMPQNLVIPRYAEDPNNPGYKSVGGIANNGFKSNTVSSTLQSITLPEGIVAIGDYAFANNTGFTQIVIPTSINSISSNAFSGCSGLTKIIVNKPQDTALVASAPWGAPNASVVWSDTAVISEKVVCDSKTKSGSQIVTTRGELKFVQITQEAYDDLPSKDSDTFYIILASSS